MGEILVPDANLKKGDVFIYEYQNVGNHKYIAHVTAKDEDKIAFDDILRIKGSMETQSNNILNRNIYNSIRSKFIFIEKLDCTKETLKEKYPQYFI
jgi:hypothetical protein